jgi:hypothetical protein
VPGKLAALPMNFVLVDPMCSGSGFLKVHAGFRSTAAQCPSIAPWSGRLGKIELWQVRRPCFGIRTNTAQLNYNWKSAH